MPPWIDVIYLDGLPTSTENEMGDTIEIPGVPRMIFANKLSIRQSEFYQAQATGLRPELAFEIRSIEYMEEEHLKYNEKKYRIIRTFDKGEFIELVCEGVVNDGTS